ncbi:MAG: hypothetical protein ACKOAY_02960 [Haliscomenobacter sp.]
MNKHIVFLLIAAMLTLGGCKWKTTKNALHHGEVLKSSVESFEKNRQVLSEKLVSSLEDAGESLSGEQPDLPKISKDFEVEWTSIQNRYGKLKKDFSDGGESSTAYFNKLDELSGSITNERLRREELSKNAALRKKWEASYQVAASNIEKITVVLEEGHDFHMVLVASSIRQKLEQNVEDLQRIATQAKTLLSDLEAFTEAGRQLVEGQPAM